VEIVQTFVQLVHQFKINNYTKKPPFGGFFA